MSDWRKAFERDAAELAAHEAGMEDVVLPLRQTDDIVIEVEWNDGYDPTFSNGPTSTMMSIRVKRDDAYILCTSYSNEEFQQFWVRLMQKGSESQ